MCYNLSMSNTAHNGTLQIRLSVRRDGVWKDIVKVVDSYRVLDEARKLAERVGARELRVGGNSYEVPLPRWVWHIDGLNSRAEAGYWGL